MKTIWKYTIGLLVEAVCSFLQYLVKSDEVANSDNQNQNEVKNEADSSTDQ